MSADYHPSICDNLARRGAGNFTVTISRYEQFVTRVAKKIAKTMKSMTFIDEQNEQQTVGEGYIKNCIKNFLATGFIIPGVKIAIEDKLKDIPILEYFWERQN